jgi:hypothetical protein
MRFISQYPLYKFQVRPQRQRGQGDGTVEVLVEPIYAEFVPVHSGGMIYENEVAQAIKHFDFRGNTQGEDEATPTDPMQRLSVFDSQEAAQENHWDEEMLALVESRLTEAAQVSTQELILVSDKPIAAPFPAYDTWDGPDVEMLVVKLIEDGHDLPLVLHYERSFGPRRANIIEALETTIELQKENVISA